MVADKIEIPSLLSIITMT